MAFPQYNYSDRLRQAYGLPQESDIQPQMRNQSGMVINVPPPDPELMQSAEQRLKEAADYTQNFPKYADYKPSRLRQILGGIAGGATGFLAANPQVGLSNYNAITTAPYRGAIRNYLTAEAPYTERAKIGIEEANLAGMSAENLYKYLSAIASNKSQEAALENAATNRAKLGMPTTLGPQMVTNIGEGVNPHETAQIYTQMDPNTGEVKWGTLKGYSTDQTYNQRLELENRRLAVEREGIAARLKVAAQSESGANQRALLTAKSAVENTLTNAQYNAVMQQMSQLYHDMFEVQQVPNPDGTTHSVLALKPGVDMNKFSKAFADVSANYLGEHNIPRTQAIREFEQNMGTDSKGPQIVVGFRADKSTRK